MRLIKDLALAFTHMMAHYYTICCRFGPPTRWKNAIITPLHECGDISSINQYWAVSNLDSISKLLEKMILNRLETLGELDGNHQHSFKKQ